MGNAMKPPAPQGDGKKKGPKQQEKKKAATAGRNKTKCQRYAAGHVREQHKARRLMRQVRKFPNNRGARVRLVEMYDQFPAHLHFARDIVGRIRKSGPENL